MMTELEERKRIIITKRYFDEFFTIREYCFVDDAKDVFLWHNKVVKDFYKIDRKITFATFSIEHDVNFSSLWEKVSFFSSEFPLIFFVYKNGMVVKIEIDDMKSFLEELFEKQSTYDFYMLSLSPDHVMAFCDNEYDVDFLYAVK